MCIVSMVGDGYTDPFPERWPKVYPHVTPLTPKPLDLKGFELAVTRQEFEALKKEVESLKEALAAASKLDKQMGNAACEHPEKVALIRRLAELVGVDLEDVLKAER